MWQLILLIGISLVASLLFIIHKKRTSIFKNAPESQNYMEGKKVRFVANADEEVNADGVCGHLEAIGDSVIQRSFYDRFWKRLLDFSISLCGLILLSPVFILISIAIFIDDPGGVFFAQKRIGQNKQYFSLHKFRSMKLSTPHDVPTHMLDNPDQYITRIGRILRKTSLDELPQIGDILIGNMSIIGPRPGLWNQDFLTAERDKYDANDIRPGLTGLAQISGRDQLEIPEKAKLDGEYVRKLNSGGWGAFMFDCKLFIVSVFKVLRRDGFVDGRTEEK